MTSLSLCTSLWWTIWPRWEIEKSTTSKFIHFLFNMGIYDHHLKNQGIFLDLEQKPFFMLIFFLLWKLVLGPETRLSFFSWWPFTPTSTRKYNKISGIFFLFLTCAKQSTRELCMLKKGEWKARNSYILCICHEPCQSMQS